MQIQIITDRVQSNSLGTDMGCKLNRKSRCYRRRNAELLFDPFYVMLLRIRLWKLYEDKYCR